MQTRSTADALDERDPTTVETERLVVEKEATAHSGDDAFKVVFTLTSLHDRPLRVQLTDDHPRDGGPREVGFHPEYDPGNWEVTADDDVRYEDTIEPGAQQETVYGFRVDEGAEIDWVFEPPTVEIMTEDTQTATADSDSESTDPPAATPPARESGDGDTRGDDDPADRSTADGFESQIPTLADGDAEAADPPAPVSAPDGGTDRIEDLQLDDGADQTGSQHQGADLSAEPAGDGESLVDDLVRELRRRDLSEAEREVLADSLGVTARNSVAVRLRHVQEKVDDLAAYRDALEAFIDDNGDAPQVIEEFRAEVDAVSDRIAGVEADLADLSTRLDDLEERQTATAERLDDRTAALETAREDAIAAVEADVENLQAAVRDGEQWRETLSEALSHDPAAEPSADG
jgi:hypothetical protein